MIHGPCGVLNPNAPCIVDGVCTKGYLKQLRDTTAENIDGYDMYRRRDNVNHIVINGNVLDNRWIVPYNPYLTKKYNAHINEIYFTHIFKWQFCSSTLAHRSSHIAMGSLMVRASDYRPEGLVPCRNCGGGDRWCSHLSSLRGISPSLIVLSPIWCSRPMAGLLLAPCHDEFRGLRSDYVRQVALETTTSI
ncbi:helitron_like_N domain-containing protein [Trichonephila clavipes]|nr:helitron_like_N domain-containing protein [Trichonephila clavipes]